MDVDGGNMQMVPGALLWTLSLSVATAVAQTTDGQIAGRINDTSGAALPGVRIVITYGDQSTEAITDRSGRFVLSALPLGTYQVVAKLEGFSQVSGEIKLSASSPRAFLAWPLVVGCLEEDVRVTYGAREAAPLVDDILHIRISSANGPALMSLRPECPGRVVREYSVQTLAAAPGRGRTSPGSRQIYTSVHIASLELGQEYVALLWSDGSATEDLVLPIVSGLVASPGESELNGMRVDEALTVLGKWSQERAR